MPQKAHRYLRSKGWEYVMGSGAHSFWRRPSDQRQRKPGKIYVRSIAVTIQKSVDREDYINGLIQELSRPKSDMGV